MGAPRVRDGPRPQRSSEEWPTRPGDRKAHRFGPVAELLFTFGLSFLAVEAVQLIWGKAAVDYRIPSSLQGALFTFHGTSYPPDELRDNESVRKEWLEV